MSANNEFRIEHDLLGKLEIPANAYYGVHTQRAIENFKISTGRIGDNHTMVKALAYTKKACALANGELGTIDPKIADLIARACDEIIINNRCFDQFPSDIYQGGDITKLKNNNQRWGFYNASAGNLDDPRFSFGLGLYIARLNGLSQYLEWHATAFNNYPYYDFDGRESDSVMFYPTTDGKLLHSVRFELATEGLHAYKKLKILETAIANNEGTASALSAAKSWLDGLRKEHYFYSSTTFMSNKKNNFREFESKLDEHLINIFLKK